MKTVITATAPTGYQLSSLNAFNLDVKKNGNGSFTGTMEFGTKEEAVEYLENRAILYFDTEEEVYAACEEIKKGYLTLDAVTARIEEVEEEI